MRPTSAGVLGLVSASPPAMQAPPTRRKAVTAFMVLGFIAVLVIVFNVGKMNASISGRTLKSAEEMSIFNAAKIDTLSWSPRVFHYHGFLTQEECDHIVALGSNDLERSMVVGHDGKSVVNNHRTSFGTFMSKYMNDPLVKGIEVENGEVFYLLRYENGQEYKPHTDWFRRDSDGLPFIGGAGQRVATVLMYLSEVEEGGETYFPKINLEVHPKKGDAVLFWNETPDHVEDDMSLHGSKPVITGTKWSLTRWIRERSMGKFHERT